MKKYSEKLGLISKQQFQQALNRFKLGKLIKAETVPFGNFGQNVFLTTSKGDFVFRGCPHYPWQFKSEQLMAKLLHKKTTVPIPFPYLVDENNDIFGWNYAIMPRLPGLNIKDRKIKNKLSTNDRLSIAKAMGENLVALQQLIWDFPGEYNKTTNGIKHLNKPYDLWIIDKITEQKNKVNSTDWQWIQKKIIEGKTWLETSFIPTFVMHDYQESNVLVDKINGVWQITGVVDLMENYFGDGESDLSRLFADYYGESSKLAHSFLNGYLNKTTVRPGFIKRWPIYMIWDRLVVWSWAKENNNIWWNKNLSFKAWCNNFMI